MGHHLNSYFWRVCRLSLWLNPWLPVSHLTPCNQKHKYSERHKEVKCIRMLNSVVWIYSNIDDERIITNVWFSCIYYFILCSYLCLIGWKIIIANFQFAYHNYSMLCCYLCSTYSLFILTLYVYILIGVVDYLPVACSMSRISEISVRLSEISVSGRAAREYWHRLILDLISPL